MFNFRGGQPPVRIVECGGRAAGKLFIFTWRPIGGSMVYLEGQGNLVRGLIIPMRHIVTLVIPMNKLHTC